MFYLNVIVKNIGLAITIFILGHTLLNAMDVAKNSSYGKIARKRNTAHTINNNYGFICKKYSCRKAFSNETQLLNHQKEHERDIACVYCDYQVSKSNESNLARHFFTRHNVNYYTCLRPGCNESFAKLAESKEHIRQGHGTSFTNSNVFKKVKFKSEHKIACNTCRHGNEQVVESHKKMHPFVYVCPDCYWPFLGKNKNNYRRHLKDDHGSAGFFCENTWCAQSFSTKNELQSHSETCYKKKPKKDQAKINFAAVASAITHIKRSDSASSKHGEHKKKSQIPYHLNDPALRRDIKFLTGSENYDYWG